MNAFINSFLCVLGVYLMWFFLWCIKSEIWMHMLHDRQIIIFFIQGGERHKAIIDFVVRVNFDNYGRTISNSSTLCMYVCMYMYVCM